MVRTAAAILTGIAASKSTALTAADILARSGAHPNPLLHFLFQFGLFGILFVSIVDSSFVPLPIPGLTDIMVIVMAAQHANWFLLVLLATLGSALGGYFSYKIGHSGGMAFLERRVPPRIFKRVTTWMEEHNILSVALPAILPPPMPLSPFVLAAGALNMSRNKFLSTFTLSRALRHAAAAWLGVYYGRHILRLWNHFSAKWATTFLIVLWTGILISCGYAFWQLYKTSRTLSSHPSSESHADLSSPKAA
jgi:membrane protein YqaA with SNARE-associated domain